MTSVCLNRKIVFFLLFVTIGLTLYYLIVSERYQPSIDSVDLSKYREYLPSPLTNFFDRRLDASNHVEPVASRYAVYGVSLPGVSKTLQQDAAWQYVFYLPLTAHAWWRLNVSSIIIISGENVSKKVWATHPKLNEIYDLIKDVPFVRFIYLPCAENRKTMISQTARIFASSFLSDIPDNTYLITSDADLLPLSDSPYRALNDTSMLLLNGYCCGNFRHGKSQYRMIPMSNIAATVTLWKALTQQHPVKSSEDITKVLGSYYTIPEKVQKGGNDGWYMDQHVVSIMIEHATFKKNLVSRSMSTRLDRANPRAWDNVKLGQNMVDAHMLLPGWKSPQRVKNLVHALFQESALVKKLDTYIDTFDKK